VLSVKGSRFQVQFGNMISTLERDKIIKTDLEKERTQKKEAPPASKKKQK